MKILILSLMLGIFVLIAIPEYSVFLSIITISLLMAYKGIKSNSKRELYNWGKLKKLSKYEFYDLLIMLISIIVLLGKGIFELSFIESIYILLLASFCYRFAILGFTRLMLEGEAMIYNNSKS